jgi:hypothetical protein
MSNADPILNNWYQDAETGRSFRVVALDSDSDSIEVQYTNGDLGEYDTASWEDSIFVPIEPAEDWSAPFDDVEVDDLGYTDPDRHGFDMQEATLEDFLDADDER